MDIFSARELATGFWLSAVILTVFAIPCTRNAALNVVYTLFDKRLVRVYLISAAYIFLILVVLNAVGFWTVAHLKNTIIWFFSIAIFSIFQINKIMEDISYFKKTALDTAKLLVVVEFIISSYPLAIWQEFILVPFLTFISALLAVAEIKPEFQTPKYNATRALLKGVLAIVGLVLIVTAIRQLIGDIQSFFTLGTLSEFLLPIFLTLLFLPYLFLLTVYAEYERVFSALPFSIKGSAARKYAHSASILAFLTDVELLRRWKRDVGISNPKSKQEVRDSIRYALKRRTAALNPVSVSIEDGWSPYAAKDFLSDLGFKTGEYHMPLHEVPDEWYAASPLSEIGDGVFPNNIAYYVDGTRESVTQLKLAVNINDPDTSRDALEELVLGANALTRKALRINLPSNVSEAIFSASEIAVQLADKSVVLQRENFQGKTNRYKLSFLINNAIDTHVINTADLS